MDMNLIAGTLPPSLSNLSKLQILYDLMKIERREREREEEREIKRVRESVCVCVERERERKSDCVRELVYECACVKVSES